MSRPDPLLYCVVKYMVGCRQSVHINGFVFSLPDSCSGKTFTVTEVIGMVDQVPHCNWTFPTIRNRGIKRRTYGESLLDPEYFIPYHNSLRSFAAIYPNTSLPPFQHRGPSQGLGPPWIPDHVHLIP
jgi:hypothetical protein